MPSIDDIVTRFRAGDAPSSIDEARALLMPFIDGLAVRVPILGRGARLFRLSRTDSRPQNISRVGAPPPGIAPLQRLNDAGQSVLYLADSPDTAFAESRVESGEFCLSEWRVAGPTLTLANGGMQSDFVIKKFPYYRGPQDFAENHDDLQKLKMFSEIFTLHADENPAMYYWSIGCGMALRFSHECDAVTTRSAEGSVELSGQYPFPGIAYASTRTDKAAVNIALNHEGRRQVYLDNVQWVRKHPDGVIEGLDFAKSWRQGGEIAWLGRSANLKLRPGDRGRIVSFGESRYVFEGEDGAIPLFL